MTDDIVTRLREYDFMRDGDTPDLTMAEAADEIERLRKMLREAGKTLTHVSVLADMMQMTEDKMIETHQRKAIETIMEQAYEIERLRNKLWKFENCLMIAESYCEPDWEGGECDNCREHTEAVRGE